MFYAHEQVFRVTVNLKSFLTPVLAIDGEAANKKVSCILGSRKGMTTEAMAPLPFHKHSAHVPTRSLTDRGCPNAVSRVIARDRALHVARYIHEPAHTRAYGTSRCAVSSPTLLQVLTPM